MGAVVVVVVVVSNLTSKNTRMQFKIQLSYTNSEASCNHVFMFEDPKCQVVCGQKT